MILTHTAIDRGSPDKNSNICYCPKLENSFALQHCGIPSIDNLSWSYRKDLGPHFPFWYDNTPSAAPKIDDNLFGFELLPEFLEISENLTVLSAH